MAFSFTWKVCHDSLRSDIFYQKFGVKPILPRPTAPPSAADTPPMQSSSANAPAAKRRHCNAPGQQQKRAVLKCTGFCYHRIAMPDVATRYELSKQQTAGLPPAQVGLHTTGAIFGLLFVQMA